MCVERWSSPFDPIESPKHYTVLLFIVLYAVPLSLMTPLYVAIARKLHKQDRTLLVSLSSSISSTSSSSFAAGRGKTKMIYTVRKMKMTKNTKRNVKDKERLMLGLDGCRQQLSQQQQQQQRRQHMTDCHSEYLREHDNNTQNDTSLKQQHLIQHQYIDKSSLNNNNNNNNNSDNSQQNNSNKINNPSSSQRMRKQNNARVVKMLLALVITFALCWLPVYLVQFFMFFHPYFVRCHREMPELAYFVAFFMQYANSAVSPCIYFAFNQTYRKAFKKVFLNN